LVRTVVIVGAVGTFAIAFVVDSAAVVSGNYGCRDVWYEVVPKPPECCNIYCRGPSDEVRCSGLKAFLHNGSPVDGIIDVVGPIGALLDVRSEFVLGGFVRERAILVACDIPWAIMKIDLARW
jgi:hypothetical protein